MPQRYAARHRKNVKAMATIEARGLRKTFGTTVALDGIDLHVEEGRILGIIGPNGAGKTTALNAILGLTSYEGELKVLGRDPWTSRDELMRDVSFIADVAVLPRWIRVSQLLDYVAGVHPRFDRLKAENFLAKTTINRTGKVRELSKGMVAQLHLAIVMAIDARLLVLDEPTLGLLELADDVTPGLSSEMARRERPLSLLYALQGRQEVVGPALCVVALQAILHEARSARLLLATECERLLQSLGDLVLVVGIDL